MIGPTYQLVLQFPEDHFVDFDALVSFDNSLCEVLGDRHDVDGHDIGSGEVNFFVLTNDPRAALREIQEDLSLWFSHPLMRDAARLADGEKVRAPVARRRQPGIHHWVLDAPRDRAHLSAFQDLRLGIPLRRSESVRPRCRRAPNEVRLAG